MKSSRERLMSRIQQLRRKNPNIMNGLEQKDKKIIKNVQKKLKSINILRTKNQSFILQTNMLTTIKQMRFSNISLINKIQCVLIQTNLSKPDTS